MRWQVCRGLGTRPAPTPDAVGAGGVSGARTQGADRSVGPAFGKPDPRHRAMSACGLASGGWFPGLQVTRRPLPYQRL